jgi:hypothetical protein
MHIRHWKLCPRKHGYRDCSIEREGLLTTTLAAQVWRSTCTIWGTRRFCGGHRFRGSTAARSIRDHCTCFGYRGVSQLGCTIMGASILSQHFSGLFAPYWRKRLHEAAPRWPHSGCNKTAKASYRSRHLGSDRYQTKDVIDAMAAETGVELTFVKSRWWNHSK